MALTANAIYPVSAIQWNGTHNYEAAAVHIYAMGAVGMALGTGYVGPLSTGTYNRFVGFAMEEVDNSSGTAGDLTVEVYDLDGEEVELTITSVAITDWMKDVYATADGTFTLTQTATAVYIGTVSRYVKANTARVRIHPWGYNWDSYTFSRLANTTTSATHTLSFPYSITVKSVYKGALVGVVTSTGAAVGTVTLSGALGYITSASPMSVAAITSLPVCATHATISAYSKVYLHEVGSKTAGRGTFVTVNYIRNQVMSR